MKLGFLALPEDERRLYIEQAAVRRNLSPVVLEKDFWVCWLLGWSVVLGVEDRRLLPEAPLHLQGDDLAAPIGKRHGENVRDPRPHGVTADRLLVRQRAELDLHRPLDTRGRMATHSMMFCIPRTLPGCELNFLFSGIVVTLDG